MSDNVALFPDIHPDSRKRDKAPERTNTGNGNPPGGSELEARVARLESDIEYVKRDIGEIKTDIKEHRKETHSDFRTMFAALIAVALGLAGMMAKGFGWL